MSRDCLFCGIVAGTVPCVMVAEDDNTVAFMDIDPGSDGHLLVVPRRHSTDLLDIPADDLTATTLAAQRIAKAAVIAFVADGVNLLNCSGAGAWQTVFHFHLHLIPRYADKTTQSRESRRCLSMVLRPQDMSHVMGEPTRQPIRVYASLESAASVEERAQLLLAEIDRTGALDRPVLRCSPPLDPDTSMMSPPRHLNTSPAETVPLLPFSTRCCRQRCPWARFEKQPRRPASSSMASCNPCWPGHRSAGRASCCPARASGIK